MLNLTSPSPQEPECERARRAFADEQHRMRHYRKALACVTDAVLRARWQRELNGSRERAARLAIMLAELGEPVPIAAEHSDAAACLLDAMDMALCNGDMPAAELVARECMALIEAGCAARYGQARA